MSKIAPPLPLGAPPLSAIAFGDGGSELANGLVLRLVLHSFSDAGSFSGAGSRLTSTAFGDGGWVGLASPRPPREKIFHQSFPGKPDFECEIQQSFENILPTLEWGQAIAGETRHYLDWFYGINLSRALMNSIKATGNFKIMSIGRVQGPALNLIVQKEKKIQAFKPKSFWQVFIIVENNGSKLELKYNKNVFDKKELEKFGGLIGKTAQAQTTKTEQILPPNPPFNLTTLQTEAYRALGLTPSQTLQIAQTLYLQGLISYPRTSSQKLPSAIGYRKILQKLLKMFPQWAKTLTRARPIEGKQQDPAHPSIYPTGEKPKQLNETEKALYELILRRFMACFAEDAIVENKRIIVKVDKKQFSSKGLRIGKKGWLDIYPTKVDEILLPDMQGKVKIQEVKTQEKQTQPPKRYTQASLITELTKRKLGTKGTRASIIETLYQRGYIKDKSIVVTNLGLAVEDSLAKYSPLILDEKLTRKFEEQMEKIQQEKDKGKILKEQKKTLGEARKTIEKISAQLKKNEDKIGKELVKGLKITREKERQENILGKCECGGNLLIRYSKKTGKRFVACSNYPKCTITFPLPQKGYIKKSDKKCPKCGRRMITILKKGRRPWTICFAGCGV